MNYQLTPEDLEKRAERSIVRSIRSQLEPVEKTLKLHRNCGAIALDGADQERFVDLLSESAGRGRLMRVPSLHNIQGPASDDDTARQQLDAFQKHKSKYRNNGIIVFEDFDYGDNETIGTPLVSNRIKKVLKHQEMFKNDGEVRRGPALMVVGSGEPKNLRTHPEFFKRAAHPVIGSLAVLTALTPSHEVSTAFDIDERLVKTPSPDSPEVRELIMSGTPLPEPAYAK
jgi:hypothetical protein